MSKNRIRTAIGSNDFMIARSKLRLNSAPRIAPSVATIPQNIAPILKSEASDSKLKEQFLNNVHRHSVAVYALLFLVIALASYPLVNKALASDIKLSVISPAKSVHPSIGLNISVNPSQLAATIKAIDSQPASLNLGSQTVAIDPNIIKSWLHVTTNASNTTSSIHINSSVISNSLTNLANQYVKAPINAVEATRSDGTSEQAIAGQNGTKLEDASTIATQAQQLAKNLMNNKGFQISSPLVTLPFQTVTPSAFSKLILVDVNSMKMYDYQDGQIVNTFLVSAGSLANPTPIGEFHIWNKLTVQNMSGYGSNGQYYYQPNVKWINYFTHTGDAVHGVYWHPLSWFGVHNSSHGCVGIPENEAEWVYNWAPIGTTVITTSA